MKPTVSRLVDEYEGRVDFKSYDTAGLSDDIRRKYQFAGQPQFVILDRRDKIAFNRFSYQSYESLKTDLEAVLASP